MNYLGSYGKHGDFLYDSSEITIWYVDIVSDRRRCNDRQLTKVKYVQDDRGDLHCHSSGVRTMLETPLPRDLGHEHDEQIEDWLLRPRFQRPFVREKAWFEPRIREPSIRWRARR